VALDPRRMWPTGLATIGLPLSGKIPAAEQVSSGRAIGRLSDIGWGSRLRRYLRDGMPDNGLPDELFNGAVEVLRTWGWEQRPVAIVAVPSVRRPVLVRTLGERLAAIGRLEWLGVLALDESQQRPASRTNSARRVQALHGSFAVTPEQAELISRLHEPVVLLVDDIVDTGWTMALAGRELRAAGAAEVLPFALALDA
jgi:ATP-dependent DNA helicase RecQ